VNRRGQSTIPIFCAKTLTAEFNRSSEETCRLQKASARAFPRTFEWGVTGHGRFNYLCPGRVGNSASSRLALGGGRTRCGRYSDSRDYCDFRESTLITIKFGALVAAKIAAEKAGISKKGVPAVIAAPATEAREKSFWLGQRELRAVRVNTKTAPRVSRGSAQRCENGCVRGAGKITDIASAGPQRLAPGGPGVSSWAERKLSGGGGKPADAERTRYPGSGNGAIEPKASQEQSGAGGRLEKKLQIAPGTVYGRLAPQIPGEPGRAELRRLGKEKLRERQDFLLSGGAAATKASMEIAGVFSQPLAEVSSPRPRTRGATLCAPSQ